MTRLSPARLGELYAGTLALVAERGFENLTMDQIAEATRSSKATLYRQWGSKVALVAEALRCSTLDPAVAGDSPADTGTLAGDLRELLARRSRALDRETDLVGSILHAVKSDATLRAAVRDQVVAAVTERLEVVLRRAMARGEIPAGHPALPFVPLVLMAPFILRHLLDDQPVDDDYLAGYLDAVVLPALGVATTSTSVATPASPTRQPSSAPLH